MDTTAYGKRHYSIDMDRPVHIEDHGGATVHHYLDETFWRDAQGNPIPEAQPLPPPVTPTKENDDG